MPFFNTVPGLVPLKIYSGSTLLTTNVNLINFTGSGVTTTVGNFNNLTITIGGGTTVNTGSLLKTASFSNPNLTFTKGDGSTFNVNLSTLVPTSASYALSSSYALSASFAPTNRTGSFTGSFTGSLLGTASYANNALTASYINPLTQSVLISGSLTVGTITSTPSTENTLTLYPPLAGGTGEGGQMLLAASGGLYTSASMIDNWQNQFRILKGTNTGGSTAGLLYMNLDNGNTQFVGAVTASAYSGLPNDYLYATRSGSAQTVVTTWANTDIIFNNNVVSKGIAYDTGTGIASLTGGKVYRITARLAWGAASTYNLQYSCYNSTNTQIGPNVEIVQSTNGTNNISDGTLEFIYAPVSNIDIKIRTTGATTALSGENIRADLNTQFIIQQIA